MAADLTTHAIKTRPVFLSRAELGALLAGTLVAGALLGAGIHAGLVPSTTGSALSAGGALAAAPVAIRAAQLAVANGPLAGDVRGVQSAKATTAAKPRSPERIVDYGPIACDQRGLPITMT